MLAELFLSIVARSPWNLRRLGLVQESVGLWSRSRRQKRAWEPHYEKCRSFVAKIIPDLQQRRTVAVLGSGLVRDVPIALLSEKFERVLLLDAVHLPNVKLAMRRYRNVELLTRDLSGVAEWLSGKTECREAPLDDLIANQEIDLVISANLLSQLPLPVANRLADHPSEAKRLPEDLPAKVVGWHLDDLATFKARICLLTDVEMREETSDGRITDRLDLMRGHKLPKPDTTWDWTVAPFGEIDRDHAYVHRVQAYARFKPGG